MDTHQITYFVTPHRVVCVISHGKDVRWKVPHLLPFVLLDVFAVVDWESLVWVDRNQNRSSVRVDDAIFLVSGVPRVAEYVQSTVAVSVIDKKTRSPMEQIV